MNERGRKQCWQAARLICILIWEINYLIKKQSLNIWHVLDQNNSRTSVIQKKQWSDELICFHIYSEWKEKFYLAEEKNVLNYQKATCDKLRLTDFRLFSALHSENSAPCQSDISSQTAQMVIIHSVWCSSDWCWNAAKKPHASDEEQQIAPSERL